MKGCFLLYSINVYSIITAIINVFNYCEMMEICVYVSCILVLWIVLSIQNLPGNAGRDQGDRDGWAEPWASDLPSLHHGCFICMLRSVVSDSVTPWASTRQAPLSMGILQARILEWVAMPSSKGSSQPRDRTQISCIAGGFFTIQATREAQGY